MAKSLAFALAAALSLSTTAASQSPDILSALRQALGGDAAVHSVARLHIVGKIEQAGIGNGSYEVNAALPDRFVQEVITKVAIPPKPPRQSPTTKDMEEINNARASASGRTATIGYQDDDAVQARQSLTGFVGNEPIPGSYRSTWKTRFPEQVKNQLDAGNRAFRRIMIPLLAGDRAASVTSASGKTLTFVDNAGVEWRVGLDDESRPLTMEWSARLGASDGSSSKYVSTFSDYRPVKGGLTWPHRIVTTIDGEPYQDLTIKRYEINGKISSYWFKK